MKYISTLRVKCKLGPKEAVEKVLAAAKVSVDKLECVFKASPEVYEFTFKKDVFGSVVSNLENGELPVESLVDTSVVVTLVNVPHELSDGVLTSHMSMYGKVLGGKRLTIEGMPTVYNGKRQLKMQLTKQIPSSINIGGGRPVWVNYRGQVRTCFRCGLAGHSAEKCEIRRCFKCDSTAHVARDCQTVSKCGACGTEGHTTASCSQSFSSKLQFGSKWKGVPGDFSAAKPTQVPTETPTQEVVEVEKESPEMEQSEDMTQFEIPTDVSGCSLWSTMPETQPASLPLLDTDFPDLSEHTGSAKRIKKS
ncbi:MAG: hypothetical protein OEZ28_09840 [Nitrospinota bacterium]|nr:hypothetical protein [Nitrospinota bacterium]